MIHLILPILLLLNDLILFQFGLEYQKLKGSYADVERAGSLRYSSPLQWRSGLGMLVRLSVYLYDKNLENRAKDFSDFLHEPSLP